jgi:hypothetical protein
MRGVLYRFGVLIKDFGERAHSRFIRNIGLAIKMLVIEWGRNDVWP